MDHDKSKNHNASPEIIQLQDAIMRCADDDPELPQLIRSLQDAWVREVQLEIDQLQGDLMGCDESDPKRPHLLRCIADSMDKFFQTTDDPKFADEALDLRKAALVLTPPNDPMIQLYRYDLACSLSDHFNESGLVEHLRFAVSLLRDVTESRACSDGLPARFDLLLQYALRAQVLFGVTHRQEDIDASIAAFIEYTDAIPDDHQVRKLARCFWMTASAMLERHKRFPSNDTLDAAFALFEKSSRVPGATSFDILHSSVLWAVTAQEHNHFSEIDAYKRAFTIYPQFIWFGYGLQVRYSRLKSSDESLKLPARAAGCAIRFNRFDQAVEWLDEGRSMLWGQMSDLRSSLTNLRRLYPDLADRFEAAGKALEESADIDEVPTRPGTTQPYSRLDASDVSDSKARHIAEWNRILDDIRAIPQFSRYLMPRSYSELKEISHRGPVFIINLATTHSDALILQSPHEPIVHIKLPEMTDGRALYLKKRMSEALRVSGRRDNRSVKRHGRADGNAILRSILVELWVSIVEPILHRVGLANMNNRDEHETLPRVWWCPTGALVDLPMHAAGRYYEDPSRNVCVGDFVISSYIPMLSTLLPSGDDYSFVLNSPRTLAIGQAKAEGVPPLPGTIKELQYVRQICGQRVTSLEGDQADIAGVVAELRTTELVHIASHGQQVGPGFESGLILHDGRLQISELIRQRVPFGRLAFLSACETAKGGLETPDEVMNIASAMLFAGFKGVVGTLWSINDADGPVVAEAFYTYLFQKPQVDTRNAAIALHFAVKKLRDNNVPLVQWVPFVHLGA